MIVLWHCLAECEEGEVVLPAPLPLSELFAQRSVYALSDGDDDRLSASCWLSNPALEELDEEPEAITCDLLDLCKRYLVDLDLEKELRKECVLQDENIVWPKHPWFAIFLTSRLFSLDIESHLSRYLI